MANTLIRRGTVSSRSVDEGEVRVTFEDQDDSVSGWLPVVVPKNLEYDELAIPDINDSVVCVFLASGLEDGFCLGVLHQGVDGQ